MENAGSDLWPLTFQPWPICLTAYRFRLACLDNYFTWFVLQFAGPTLEARPPASWVTTACSRRDWDVARPVASQLNDSFSVVDTSLEDFTNLPVNWVCCAYEQLPDVIWNGWSEMDLWSGENEARCREQKNKRKHKLERREEKKSITLSS